MGFNYKKISKLSIILSINIIIILAINFVSFFALHDLKINFDSIKINWSFSPINEIQVYNDFGSCPIDSQLFFNYKWPGTEKGCFCNNSLNNLTIGICDSDKKNCVNIPEIEPYSLNYWKNNNHLCVKKIDNMNYQNIKNFIFPNKTCNNEEFQNCSFFQGKYKLCIPKNVLCPITEMKISLNNPNPNIFDENDKLPYVDKYYLWISRKSHFLPIVEGKIAIDGICYDNTQGYNKNNYINYKLNKLEENHCESDKRWKNLNDPIDEFDLLIGNGMTEIISPLPEFKHDQNFHYERFFRSMIAFDLNEDDCNIDNLNDDQELIEHVKNIQLICLILNFIAFLYVLFFLPYLLNRRSILENKTKCMVYFGFYYILAVVLSLIFIVLAAYTTSVSNSYSNIKQLKCSDDITNNQFDDISNYLKSSILPKYIVLIVFSIAAIIIFTIIYYYQKYYKFAIENKRLNGQHKTSECELNNEHSLKDEEIEKSEQMSNQL